MFSLWVQNERGETYELTHQPDKFIVSEVDGLGYPVNNINISPAVNVDGGRYNSAHLNTRNIVITVHFVGYNIETRRHELYKMLPAKSKVKVMYKCKERHVYTEGYVENIDVPIFVKHEIAQISILCPDAYWHDFSTIVGQTSYSLAMFKFPEGFPEQGETISVRYDNPVCRMQNRGDAAVGFKGKITIETDEQPTLGLIPHTETLVENIASVYIPFPDSWYPDGDRFITILVNGEKLTSGFTQGWVTYDDSSTRDMLVSLHGKFFRLGDTVSAQTRETFTGRYDTSYSTDWESFELYNEDYSGPFRILVPTWYATSLHSSVLIQGSRKAGGQIMEEYIHEIPAERCSWEIVTIDGEDFFSVTYTGGFYEAEWWNECFIRVTIYGDKEQQMERIIHKQDITVNYPDRVFIPRNIIGNFDYDTDKLRVYAGGTEIYNWTHSEAVFSIYQQVDFTCIRLPSPMTTSMLFQFISYLGGGVDIRDWTDEQIDEGLLIVDGLRITNTSTNEYLDLSERQFRNGDVIEFSTVAGDLYVTLAESTYSTPGESLLYAVSGDFFKLVPGVNILEITASVNTDMVSGEFSASQLWAGV